MSTEIKCDRCGSNKSNLIIHTYTNKEVTEINIHAQYSFDICDNCVEEFKEKFMRENNE